MSRHSEKLCYATIDEVGGQTKLSVECINHNIIKQVWIVCL